jgi:hypothetical protein
MKRKRSAFPFLVLFSLPVSLYSQLWSGILLPTSGSGACTLSTGHCAIDWTASGIPGGIPSGSWTQSGSTITAGQRPCNSGSGDCTSTIQAALNACSGGSKYVLLGAGTFLINGNLTVPDHCVLRGSGADQTILNANGTSGAVVALGSGSAMPSASNSVAITSGTTAGSTSITAASATGISVGGYLLISELNNSNYVSINGSEGACTWCDGALWNGTRVRGQIVEVESVAGTAIGISPALYTAYSNTPLATPFTATAKYAGVENLQVYANNTGYGDNFAMWECAYCWLSGVEGNYADGNHVDVSFSYRGQIQNSYFSNAYLHGPGSYDSDITLYNKSSGMLVQNNILERLHVTIMLEWGAAGNVIAYNYDFGNYASGSTTFETEGMNTHGAHPQFNLWEGNITQNFDLDSIWGSHSHNTVFRNWSKGTTKLCTTGTPGRTTVTCANTWAVQYVAGMKVDFLGSSYNVVGNVIGSQDLASLNVYNAAQSPMAQGNMVVSICGPSPCGPGSRSYDAVAYGYNFGFGEASDDGTGGVSNGAGCSPTTLPYPCHSLVPYSTLFSHGNYSSPSAAINWTAGITRTLPPSLYLSSKPSWFGNVPWPAIGPDIVGGLSDAYGYAYANPAEVCYEQVMGGTDGTGSALAFNANSCYGQPTSPAPPANVTAVVNSTN